MSNALTNWLETPPRIATREMECNRPGPIASGGKPSCAR